MFDSLANANNQNQAAVDDIFAETDNKTTPRVGQPAAVVTPGSAINVQRVGLAVDDNFGESSNKSTFGWGFKIAVVVIILAILGLGGYLVYEKFFKPVPAEINIADLNSTANGSDEVSPVNPVVSDKVDNLNPDDSFVTPGADALKNNQASTTLPGDPTLDIPGTSTPDNSFTPVIDSDGDGLSDDEEKVLGLNISIIDTDNDALSDYEEVKVYKTNPLLADTDGDGYSDGAEIKGGYNPNGAGKLSDAPIPAPVNP